MVKIYRVIRIKLNQLVYENIRISAILLRKLCPSKKHILQSLTYNMAENSWHRYDMKKLRHCQSVTQCIRTVRRVDLQNGDRIATIDM